MSYYFGWREEREVLRGAPCFSGKDLICSCCSTHLWLHKRLHITQCHLWTETPIASIHHHQMNRHVQPYGYLPWSHYYLHEKLSLWIVEEKEAALIVIRCWDNSQFMFCLLTGRLCKCTFFHYTCQFGVNSPLGHDVIMKKRTVHTKNDHYNDNTVTDEWKHCVYSRAGHVLHAPVIWSVTAVQCTKTQRKPLTYKNQKNSK